MTTLLELATSAHGGADRWASICRFQAQLSITGSIWTGKGVPDLFGNVRLWGETRDQRLVIAPFPETGMYSTWEPHRETIEISDGRPIIERTDPASLFRGHSGQTSWEPLHAIYFASEVNWNCFVTPFILSRGDFLVHEIDPWQEDGEIWRRLRVTYPESIISHCKQQTYYFEKTGLLRRLDYEVDILGGVPFVDYPSDYQECDGIMVPTRRRAYRRNSDGTPMLDRVAVAIDVLDASFS